MAKKKEPEGVVIPVHDTKPLHNQLRSVAGMSQGLEVQVDGVPLKLRGLHIYSHKRGGEFGTLVLDFLTVKAKAKPKPTEMIRGPGWLSGRLIKNPKAKKGKVLPPAQKGKGTSGSTLGLKAKPKKGNGK